MPLTPRHIIAAVALCATAACLDTTRPQYHISSHTLLAYTNSMTAGDSIECAVYASLPLADSIQTPWTGTVPVQVRRTRKATTGPITTDTTVTGMTIDLTRGVGDSLQVAIHGAFSLVLSGRMVQSPYDATGDWRCDDAVPLAQVAPGAANGIWYLSADRPID